MIRVAICWPRFGPYHLARIEATAQAHTNALDLIGVDTNPAETTYAWEVPPVASSIWEHARADRISIEQVLTQQSPDVVCVNGWGYRDSRRVLAWAVQHNVPVVLFSDSRQSDTRRRWWSERIKQSLVGLCSAAIVAGSEHCEYLVSLGMPAERVFTGLDVVDNDYFSTQCRTYESRPPILHEQLGKDPYFLFVGRFVKKKNLSRLLVAFSDYIERNGAAAWKLALVGDGPLRSALQDQIARLGLSPWVVHVPFQQYDVLPSIYRFAGALILPSCENEQWGLVANEASACGTPLLVSNACGCVDSLLQQGVNGWSFDPYDAEELAEKMRLISRADPATRARMGEAGRQIVSRWGLDRFSDSLRAATDLAVHSPRPGSFLGRRLAWLVNTRPLTVSR